MKRKFVIKGHYSQSNNKKYYTIERKNLCIFNSEYIIPLFYSQDEDYIVTYSKRNFYDPDKALEVLQKLEKFYALNTPEIQIAWNFVKDTYVYIPKNNLSNKLGYYDIINKDLVFTTPLDALLEYSEIENRKKSWVEKTVMFKNGKMC